MSGSGEHENEPSGSIKGGKFLDYLDDCLLLMKDSTQWLVSQLVSGIKGKCHL